MLRGEGALGELVEEHLNRTLTLWVYNSEFDVVREVQLVPSRNWGGEGALGAVLGYGALHRLPLPLGEEVEAPGQVVFEMKEGTESEKGQDQDLDQAQTLSPPPSQFVPANVIQPQRPPQTSPAPGGRHGRKHRHAQAPGVSFDDYFRESEQKSKEQDFVPGGNRTPVAPPPKAAQSPPTDTGAKVEDET
jgi:hypothetical protein